jgi:hypothetical protein
MRMKYWVQPPLEYPKALQKREVNWTCQFQEGKNKKETHKLVQID